MLNNFKWYRKLRGGRWEFITDIYHYIEYWIRNRKEQLNHNQHIVITEDYDKHNKQ